MENFYRLPGSLKAVQQHCPKVNETDSMLLSDVQGYTLCSVDGSDCGYMALSLFIRHGPKPGLKKERYLLDA